MKSGLYIRIFTQCALVLAAVLLFGGCARSPAGISSTSVRGLSFQINFNGPVNDDYYYCTVIDINGGDTGPLPIFPNPSLPTGNDWVTGSATHFVMYHQRQYTLYRIDHLNPLQYTAIGTPVRSVVPDMGSNSLNFTVDLDAIGATGPSVDVNIITLNQFAPDGRLLDALGPLGSDFVSIGINSNRTYRNSDAARPEGLDDVLNQNGAPVPETDQTAPLDIMDWTITTNT